MLVELGVRDLGVIEELYVVLHPGMTALTGETGAGKTLLVEALELLVGGRADPSLVRPGAEEASVEGRFELDGEELVISRVIPAEGRSRAWINARMAPVSALGEVGSRLVDLHGQHAHQSLLSVGAQRAALDAFAGIDHRPVDQVRGRLGEIEDTIASLGGDARSRAREVDLLRFQVDELERAMLSRDDEDEQLRIEEERLSSIRQHREAAESAVAVLRGDGSGTGQAVSVDELVGMALAAIAGRGPLAEAEPRLRGVAAEVADLASALRSLAEGLEDDPARLDAVRARSQLLWDLQRKYGDSLAEVRAYAGQACDRLAQLESYEARAVELDKELTAAVHAVAEAEAAQGWARRSAAPQLAACVEANLKTLAMPNARFEVRVGEAVSGDDVTFYLGANAGEPVRPLAKVASGGELSRAMLATRLVRSSGPPTLVFDEVDAGIGGEAALSVGRALAALAPTHQVLVVTHLPQVAAFADHQVSLRKADRGGRTLAEALELDTSGRVVELSRMLSGQPSSSSAQVHAEELLKVAAEQRAS